MVSMRRYGTCTAYLALAFSIGCSVGSETEQPTGQVRLEQTKSVLLAVAVPGQSATLDIWGVQTGIPMAVDTDGSVTATVPNVPAGLRTFQINYRSGGIGPNSFLVAQAGASATVGADTTTPVTLTAVHREFDDDGDGTSNFNEAFAGTNPTDPGSGGTPGATVPAIGDSHTCTVLAGGSVRCWGSNLVGELGNGTTVSASSPVVVTGVAGATTVAAGSIFSCARIANGTVQCWGFNQFGQLGDGTTTDRVTAVNVTGITSATQVASGADSHSCARLVDGTVRCWGKNNFGQLGNGTTINSSSPVEVLGINNAISVTTGFNYSCAALADGTVRCWGRNDVGQLGNGSTSNSAVPVAVSGITTAAAVAVADTVALASSTSLSSVGERMMWVNWGMGPPVTRSFQWSSLESAAPHRWGLAPCIAAPGWPTVR